MQSPVKSCTLDPVPTFLVRDFIDLLLPYVTMMVNESLIAGRLPNSHKHAIMTLRLKKYGLDSTDTANFRPISNLTFLSKVVERAVAIKLNAHLSTNGMLPRYQSAYRNKHSTETAMLRVWYDFLTSADACKVTLFGLFDLSAAFDCVDHDILLQRLEVVFGLTDTALDWIRSFVSGRTQQVSYHSRLSLPQSVLFGLPRTSLMTAACCRMPAVTRCGRIPMNCGICSYRAHTANWVTSFSVAGPRLWNDLPPRLRRPGLSFDTFRQSLKTYLFGDRST